MKFTLFQEVLLVLIFSFVISGYLIGKIIENQNFSISNYKRFLFKRVRRIFPGLFVLLMFSFITFSLILSPEHFIDYSKSIISNLILFQIFIFGHKVIILMYQAIINLFYILGRLELSIIFILIWPLIIWFLKSLIKDKFFLKYIPNFFIFISLFLNLYVISFGPIFENKVLYGKYVSDTIFYLTPFRIF